MRIVPIKPNRGAISKAARLRAGLAVCLLGALCPLCPIQAAPENQAVQEIASLEKAYSQSFVTGDTRVAGRLVADDFVGVEPDGKTSDKPAILADVKSTPRPVSLRIPALAVRLHDDTAIALGTEEDVYAGKTGITRRRWLDTWKKTPGGWRLVSSAELLLQN